MVRLQQLSAPLLALSSLVLVSGNASDGKTEFDRQISTADRAFDESRYRDAVDALREAIVIANRELMTAVLATMPSAPVGFERVLKNERSGAAQNPMAAAMTAAVGMPIEQRYTQKVVAEGERPGQIQIRVLPRSPAARLLQAQIGAFEPNEQAELIEAGPSLGILFRRPRDLSMRLLVNNKHVVDVVAWGIDEEKLVAMVDARFLRAVGETLGE